MRDRLGKKSADQADVSNALRPLSRSQRIQPSRPHANLVCSSRTSLISYCVPLTLSSCCAKLQQTRRIGWVIDSDPATALRCAQDDGEVRRVQDGGVRGRFARDDGVERRAYAMVANSAL